MVLQVQVVAMVEMEQMVKKEIKVPHQVASVRNKRQRVNPEMMVKMERMEKQEAQAKPICLPAFSSMVLMSPTSFPLRYILSQETEVLVVLEVMEVMWRWR